MPNHFTTEIQGTLVQFGPTCLIALTRAQQDAAQLVPLNKPVTLIATEELDQLLKEVETLKNSVAGLNS